MFDVKHFFVRDKRLTKKCRSPARSPIGSLSSTNRSALKFLFTPDIDRILKESSTKKFRTHSPKIIHGVFHRFPVTVHACASLDAILYFLLLPDCDWLGILSVWLARSLLRLLLLQLLLFLLRRRRRLFIVRSVCFSLALALPLHLNRQQGLFLRVSSTRNKLLLYLLLPLLVPPRLLLRRTTTLVLVLSRFHNTR